MIVSKVISHLFYAKIIFYYYLLISISLSQEVSDNMNRKLQMVDILPDGYSRDNPPVNDGKPVEVYIAITVLSLLPDSNAKMVFVMFHIRKSFFHPNCCTRFKKE
jgi:hypothetical protein